jgi:hypothetical protein
MLPSDLAIPMPRHPRHTVEEEAAWLRLYRSASDPAVAVEVVHHFDTDPEAKHRYLGLYLVCRTTLRQHHERLLRRERINALAHALCAPFIAVPAALWHAATFNRSATTTTRRGSRKAATADKVPVLKEALQADQPTAATPPADNAEPQAVHTAQVDPTPLREAA